MFHGLNSSGIHPSLWFTDVKIPTFPELNQNLSVDVCIIGGGIAGISIAYQLTKLGKSVVILEDGKICSGETGRTTGHLASAIDDHFTEIEKVFGEEGSRLTAESHAKAIDEIEKISTTENIACDFIRVDGYLFLEPNYTIEDLKKEVDASIRAGLKAELIENPDLKGIKIPAAIRYQNQAQFHPLKYLIALAEIVQRQGGKIFEKTHAEKIESGNEIKITTHNNFIIHAKYLVIATNSPVYDKSLLVTKQESNRTYVVGARIAKNQVQKALFWGTGDPYHYVRVHPATETHDWVTIGGEDHRTGEPFPAEEKFSALKKWAKHHLPDLGEFEFEWSGQINEPYDDLAFIGRESSKEKNIFVVTGDSGNGLTHATIASLLIPDLILDKPNPWEKLYDPERKKHFKNLATLVSTNLKGAEKYINYLTPGEVSDIKEMKPGTGAILRKGLSKIAVYCDQDGKHHERSAICPHMGGIVCWNATEHSWDCPIHGSRFTVYGDVINGPSIKDLPEVEKEKE